MLLIVILQEWLALGYTKQLRKDKMKTEGDE